MFEEKKREIAAGLFLLLIGVILLIASFRVPRGAALTIGSDFMPKVTCGVITILGVIVILEGMKKKTEATAQKIERKNYCALVETIILLFLYMFLLVPVGFVVTTAVYITVQTMILAPAEKRNPVLFGIVGIVAAFVVYFIFRNVFVLMLPAGILKFM